MSRTEPSNIVKESRIEYEVEDLSRRNVNLKDKEEVLDDICEYLSNKGNITRLEVQSMSGFGQTKSVKLLKEL